MDQSNLEYIRVGDLKPGDFFTLGVNSPLTFVARGHHLTMRGSVQLDASCLAGMRDGAAYTSTFYRPALEVLLVPENVVGERVAAAVEAFSDRQFRGHERIELPSGVWPWADAVMTGGEPEVAA